MLSDGHQEPRKYINTYKARWSAVGCGGEMLLGGCCNCACLKPHYKRLVDSIFPAYPEDGLVKSNMDKLTFFAIKSPEKLDRIGEYLALRLSRDVSRQRIGFVLIAMEALDTLLVSCHAQTLNLFVESFLKMVQKLLEQNDPELQIVATTSFIKFANIEEDTPSYHRRYDFFVSKFSSMCHNAESDLTTKHRLRVAGLHGLQGVVRKTVSDDLQVNIWEHTHMDKIVPSLLYNMQQAKRHNVGQDSPNDEEQPDVVGEIVFRDLVCRASYGNINSVIKPVLTHLDHHKLWVPNDFAVKCFKIIMYSVQAQYGYVVVQMLMSHLDDKVREEPLIRASIVGVLAETVLIAAGGSIGPSVLEVFHALLRHLRLSVDADSDRHHMKQEEENFQEAIITTIGEFANNLPDYQKIEILMFVMSKMPKPSENASSREVTLQTMLMKTLLTVATKYKTVLMDKAFPSAFLEPLLKMSLVADPGIRKIVQEILHTLIDRHENTHKLKIVGIPEDISSLNLNVEKPPRQDIMFMKKNGPLFYWHIYENMQKISNKVDNFEALYCTLCLLCLEMGGDEVLIELFRLAIGLQRLAIISSLPITHKCAIHAVVAAYLNIMCQLTGIPELCQHVSQVIEARKEEAPFYLPNVAFNRTNTSSSYEEDEEGYPITGELKPEWKFNTEVISEALQENGHEVSHLQTPFVPHNSHSFGLGDGAPPNNTVDYSASNSDIASVSIDLESGASTPGSRLSIAEEPVTFESCKKILDSNPREKEAEDEKQRKIYESYKFGPFEDIVARSEAKATKFHNRLNGILEKISDSESPHNSPQKMHHAIPITEMKFPELFIY